MLYIINYNSQQKMMLYPDPMAGMEEPCPVQIPPCVPFVRPHLIDSGRAALRHRRQFAPQHSLEVPPRLPQHHASSEEGVQQASRDPENLSCSVEGIHECLRELDVNPVLKELSRRDAITAEPLIIGMTDAFLVLGINSGRLKTLLQESDHDKPSSMVTWTQSQG